MADYPEAKTIPGLLIYRFESNLVFFNADYFKTRVRAAVAAQKTPVEWIVVDASPINVIDVTALRKLDELRHELAAEGVSLYYARLKRHLERFFNPQFAKERRKAGKQYRFQTLKPAIRAYLKYRKAKGLEVGTEETDDSEEHGEAWREPVHALRMEEPGAVPESPAGANPER